MGCDSWKAKLDTYLDGELPAEEMRPFAEHVRGCPTCAADALARAEEQWLEASTQFDEAAG